MTRLRVDSGRGLSSGAGQRERIGDQHIALTWWDRQRPLFQAASASVRDWARVRNTPVTSASASIAT